MRLKNRGHCFSKHVVYAVGVHKYVQGKLTYVVGMTSYLVQREGGKYVPLHAYFIDGPQATNNECVYVKLVLLSKHVAIQVR